MKTRTYSVLMGLLLWTVPFTSTGLSGAEPGAANARASGSSSSNRPTGLHQAVSIRFLDREQARASIVDDQLAPYFSRLQRREIATLTGQRVDPPLAAARDTARDRFQAAARAFSEREAESIRWCVVSLLNQLSGQYPTFHNHNWQFLKVANSHCGGSSHTRGSTIIFSQRTVDRFVHIRQFDDALKAARQVGPLLVHEQLHVFQRLHPDHFGQLYSDVWGFEQATIELPQEVLRDVIHNPDASGTQWVIPPALSEMVDRPFLPLTRLRQGPEIAQMGRDFQDIGVVVRRDAAGKYHWVADTDGSPIVVPLDQLSQLQQSFGTDKGLSHPNELAAYLFQDVLRETLAGKADTNPSSDSSQSFLPERVRAFRTWCETGFDFGPQA